MIKINKKLNTDNKRSNVKKKNYYTGFNIINGYIPKYNLMINELNNYIAIIEVLNFRSLKYLATNMEEFNVKEIQIFSHNSKTFATLKFIKLDKKNNNITVFHNSLKEISLRNTEFRVLDLYEIYKIVREKVFLDNDLKNFEIKKILFNSKNSKQEFQNNIYAKSVKIDNDYILFNSNNDVYHQVIGLQMYPSFLFKGYLTEISQLSNVETCTYIKNIDIEQVRKNVKTYGQDMILNDHINKVKRIYNTCFYIHIFGDKETIKKTKEIIIELSEKYHVLINEFIKQQQRAYCAFLPFMNNKIKCYRAIEDIDGILPYNKDFLSEFDCNMFYGYEKITDRKFYYDRKNNGIVLSSNNETKKMFIQNEKNYCIVDLQKECITIDFNKNKKNDLSFSAIINYFIYEKSCKELNDYSLYLLFKMYCYLCLGNYRENRIIDKNDYEILASVFLKLEEKIDKDIINFIDTKNRFLNYLDKNNNKIYKKIMKTYDRPSEKIIYHIDMIFYILKLIKDKYNSYVYINNIQEITNCLHILLRIINDNKDLNKILLSSENDYTLLNNDYISNELFKLDYINIIDIKSNDLVKINYYLDLSDTDINYLNNKTNITGMLLTDKCEYSYYLEKDDEDESI